MISGSHQCSVKSPKFDQSNAPKIDNRQIAHKTEPIKTCPCSRKKFHLVSWKPHDRAKMLRNHSLGGKKARAERVRESARTNNMAADYTIFAAHSAHSCFVRLFLQIVFEIWKERTGCRRLCTLISFVKNDGTIFTWKISYYTEFFVNMRMKRRHGKLL